MGCETETQNKKIKKTLAGLRFFRVAPQFFLTIFMIGNTDEVVCRSIRPCFVTVSFFEFQNICVSCGVKPISTNTTYIYEVSHQGALSNFWFYGMYAEGGLFLKAVKKKVVP